MHSQWLPRAQKFSSYPIFRKLLAGVTIFTVYSIVEIYLENRILGGDLQFPQGVHTLLGVALSILLVFRTNATYDRWWEGRKLWGALVNNNRNLGQIVSQLPIDDSDKLELGELQRSFPYTLRDHLRLPAQPPFNAPLDLSHKMMGASLRWLREGKITPQEWQSVELRIAPYQDITGACERIRRTPLPLSHRAIIPQVLLTYLIVLPWGLPNTWSTPLIVGAVSYFILSLELIAEELEEPFGFEPDDLPLTTYSNNIAGNVKQMYGEVLPHRDPEP